jgi:POT family proton-dependent oligopeptide transporter
VLSDYKFALFLVILGLFFWTPFWAFFNVLTVYINDYMDTAVLFASVSSVIGETIPKLLIASEVNGVWRINAEAISHTGYIIIVLQLVISRIFEKRPAIQSFNFGLFVAAIGFVTLAMAVTDITELVFLGIFLFAIGEMISSPRIQEYIMWIAPKEKAGLYMGTNFLAVFSRCHCQPDLYGQLMDYFEDNRTPGDTLCMPLRRIRYSESLPSMFLPKHWANLKNSKRPPSKHLAG